MPKLKCLNRYRNRNVVYNVGEIFNVDADIAAALMTDSPGSFELFAEPKPARVSTAVAEPESTEPKPKRRSTRRKSG